jgi:hypothetical protein
MSGSISTKQGYPGDVRFPPNSDQTADIADGPVGAISRNAKVAAVPRSVIGYFWETRLEAAFRAMVEAILFGAQRVQYLFGEYLQ